MRLWLLAILAVQLLLGIFLLGDGITGMMVYSTTCCQPPHCTPEQWCSQQQASTPVYAGVVLVTVAIVSYAMMRKIG